MPTIDLTPNHKRRVKVFWIISRVFIPLGIILTVLGAVGLPLSIWGLVAAVEKEGAKAGVVVFEIVYSYIGMGFGISFLVLGVPMIITGSIFRGLSISERREDERNGTDYTDYPYGK